MLVLKVKSHEVDAVKNVSLAYVAHLCGEGMEGRESQSISIVIHVLLPIQL